MNKDVKQPEDILDCLIAPACVGRLRALLFVAHPDDEVIGAGSRLGRFARTVIVHVTDGAPKDPRFAQEAGFDSPETYGRARHDELRCVLAAADIPEEDSISLGISDQEAALHLPDLAWRVAGLISEYEPDLVLTHPYEGGHPDHDATAFAVQAAARLLAAEGKTVPAIAEMSFYHRAGGIYTTDAFLPGSSRQWTLTLTEQEREFKERLRACHASQRVMLSDFEFTTERFRIAPSYDFTTAPHQGTLNYETWNFPMTGARFRELAGAALTQLGLTAPVVAG